MSEGKETENVAQEDDPGGKRFIKKETQRGEDDPGKQQENGVADIVRFALVYGV